jgi:sec-independent protein translocase protein TatC
MKPLNEYFTNHLGELRQRLIISFGTIFLFCVVAYLFIKPITQLLVTPLFTAYPDLASLIYTNLTEAFFSYLKLAILVGIIASCPMILYQIWMFVSPGLKKNEKRQALLVVLGATFLFVGGVLFSYLVVLPEMLSFFMGFARENLQPMPKFGAYLTFVARNALAFGLAFEVPFLMVAATRSGLVKRGYFRKQRLYAYAALFGLGFLLAAGDPFSAVLVAIPLGILYEFGSLFN